MEIKIDCVCYQISFNKEDLNPWSELNHNNIKENIMQFNARQDSSLDEILMITRSRMKAYSKKS